MNLKKSETAPVYCVTAYAQMRNGNLRRRVLTVHADDEHKAVALAVKEIKEDPEVSIVAAVMDVSLIEEGEKVWTESFFITSSEEA